MGRMQECVKSESFDRLLVYAFWAALLFAFVMALLPKPPQLPTDPSDKVQHMIAFGVLACLASRAYYQTAYWKVFLGLAAAGAAIELLQSIPVLHRDASLLDFVVDCGAVAVVLLVTHIRHGSPKARHH